MRRSLLHVDLRLPLPCAVKDVKEFCTDTDMFVNLGNPCATMRYHQQRAVAEKAEAAFLHSEAIRIADEKNYDNQTFARVRAARAARRESERASLMRAEGGERVSSFFYIVSDSVVSEGSCDRGI